MNPDQLRDPLARRSFVEFCARAAFGLTVLPAGVQHAFGAKGAGKSAAPASSALAGKGPGFGAAKHVIMLFMDGGMSHIDSYDPKTGPTKGPGSAISTKGDFQLTSFFPETAKVGDKITVVRSMSAKVGVHDSARYLMRTGFEKRGTIVHPVLGAWAQHYLGPSSKTLPSSVCINQSAAHGNGFFPATYSPLPLLDPQSGLANSRSLVPEDKAQARLELLAKVNADYLQKAADENVRAYTDFYDSTMGLMKSSDLKAFDLSAESAENRDRYGKGRFGQGCLLARRLVENGVRFVEVHSGGWDMHKDLEDAMEDRGGELDKAFAALVQDLDARGLLSSTLVVITTEFGRKPSFEGGGRGHHPIVFSSVLAGGGVKGGYAYGQSDDKGHSVKSDGVSPGDLHATIGWAAGLRLDEEVITPSGRPMTVGNKGKPAMGVFA